MSDELNNELEMKKKTKLTYEPDQIFHLNKASGMTLSVVFAPSKSVIDRIKQ